MSARRRAPRGLRQRIIQALGWRDAAVCDGEPLELFFGPHEDQPPEDARTRELRITAAKDMCARCPVRSDCLTEALREGTAQYGIRGGLTEDERAHERRRRMRNNTLWAA